MAARRRLLYLGHELPIPVSSAGRLRTYNWILHLSKRFDVTFVAPALTPPASSHIEALQPYCERILLPLLRGSNRNLRTLVQRALAELQWLLGGEPPEAWFLQRGEARAALASAGGPFDVVFAERWTWGLEALHQGTRLVLDSTALQSEAQARALRASPNPLRRLLAPWLRHQLAVREARAVGAAALVLTGSPEACEKMRRLRGDKAAIVLPSGLCTRYFAPRRAVIDPSKVLFAGALSSPARRDALIHLQRDIMPLVRQHLRHAHVTVVGSAPIPELEAESKGQDLHFTGALEDDRVEMWHAAVAALPLRFGSGPPRLVAQLLAMGIPVVATPLAVRGLAVRSGEGVLVAAPGEEFASALASVLQDASLREDLSARGREVAQTRLSLDATYDRVSLLLHHAPLARDLHAA